MRELYNAIARYRDNRDCIVVTGISGDIEGNEALVAGQEFVYSTFREGVLTGCADDLLKVESAKIVDTVAGSVFVERLNARERIIVCGAGTVGQEVVKLAKLLGLTVIVLEDRCEFADIAGNLGADKVYCKEFADGLKELEQMEHDYYVVVTREHRYDKVCLEHILRGKHQYVGMMASRNRASILKDALSSEGFNDNEVDAIHSPIGIGINAETPAEIAVSIMAEIIKIKNESVKSEGYKGEILEELCGGRMSERMVLATIVKRVGSTPRDVGTKMIIYENDSNVGSIGGGWIEAEVIKAAKNMFLTDVRSVLYEADKESRDAVLCGGYETIYLEMIG